LKLGPWRGVPARGTAKALNEGTADGAWDHTCLCLSLRGSMVQLDSNAHSEGRARLLRASLSTV